MLYLRKEYFSLLGGTYNGSCILQGYVDEKRLKTPALESRSAYLRKPSSMSCSRCREVERSRVAPLVRLFLAAQPATAKEIYTNLGACCETRWWKRWPTTELHAARESYAVARLHCVRSARRTLPGKPAWQELQAGCNNKPYLLSALITGLIYHSNAAADGKQEFLRGSQTRIGRFPFNATIFADGILVRSSEASTISV